MFNEVVTKTQWLIFCHPVCDRGKSLCDDYVDTLSSVHRVNVKVKLLCETVSRCLCCGHYVCDRRIQNVRDCRSFSVTVACGFTVTT